MSSFIRGTSRTMTIIAALLLVAVGNGYYAFLRMRGRIRTWVQEHLNLSMLPRNENTYDSSETMKRDTLPSGAGNQDKRYSRIHITTAPVTAAPRPLVGHFERGTWSNGTMEQVITSGYPTPLANATVEKPSGYPVDTNEPWKEYAWEGGGELITERFPTFSNHDTKPPSFDNPYTGETKKLRTTAPYQDTIRPTLGDIQRNYATYNNGLSAGEEIGIIQYEPDTYSTNELFTKVIRSGDVSEDTMRVAEKQMHAFCLTWAQHERRRLISLSMSWEHTNEWTWTLTASALFSKKFIVLDTSTHGNV
jgi:hypothetical protein